MDERQLGLYKKTKRRENRSRTRQALFVSEYIYYKYFHLYQEAAELYNNINEIYPQKPDLRRTEQFRVWKTNIMRGQSTNIIKNPNQKQRQYVFPPHKNIPIARYVDPADSLVVMCDSGNHQYENSPSENSRTESKSPQTAPESPPTEPESPQTASESPRTEPENLQAESTTVEKVMQLRIPLLATSAKTHKVTQEALSIPAETRQTVTEEVIQESTDILQPSLLEEISPEIIDKIIMELRQEPQLRGIVTEIEQQIEVEQLGLDIDIPDLYDPMEDELENILW